MPSDADPARPLPVKASGAPEGFLGVRWGDDAGAAARSLGLDCDRWTPWEGSGAYDACFDTDHPVVAFGHQALVRLFRHERRIVGLSLRFLHCGATREALTSAVAAAYRLSTTDGAPYQSYEDASAVRLDYDAGDDSCRLTLAGPAFGPALASYLLGTGLRGLAAGLGPN